MLILKDSLQLSRLILWSANYNIRTELYLQIRQDFFINILISQKYSTKINKSSNKKNGCLQTLGLNSDALKYFYNHSSLVGV